MQRTPALIPTALIPTALLLTLAATSCGGGGGTSGSTNSPFPPPSGNPTDARGAIHLNCDSFVGEDKIILEDNPDHPVDYIVECLIEISNAEFDVYEGTVIEFEKDAGFIFRDTTDVSLVSVSDVPSIVFRGTVATPGHWKGLRFEHPDERINRTLDFTMSDAGDPDDPMFPGAITVIGGLTMGSSRLDNIEGVGVWVEDGANLQDFSNNEVSRCSSYPIRVPLHKADELLQGNVYEGNGTNRVLVGDTGFEETIRFTDQGIPFELQADLTTDSLTFEDDVEIVVADGVRISVGRNFSTGLTQSVHIHALSGAPGAWRGLLLGTDTTPPSTAWRIHRVKIEHGGGGSNYPGNISILHGDVDVKDSEIADSASCGIRYDDSWDYDDRGGNTFRDNQGGHVCGV